MDLDKMMGHIYAPANSTWERRQATALTCYHETRIKYGNGSPEEKQVYALLVNIFPEMEGLCETIDSLRAALGQERILISPENLEAYLESVGLTEE